MMYIYGQDHFADVTEENTTIIFDTNVIIDWYTYSPFAIKEIIVAIKNNVDYFWLPYQVEYEYKTTFSKRRSDAIKRYTNLNSTTQKEINSLLVKLQAEYTKFINSGNSEVNEVVKIVNDSLGFAAKESSKEIKILDKKYQETIEKVLLDDIIEGLVDELSEFSAARKITRHELVEIFEEGEQRYKYALSPGFTDINKKETLQSNSDLRLKKYGDLMIWKEILEYAEKTNKNIILVQNERKSDWWDKQNKESKYIPINMLEEFKGANDGSTYSVIRFEEFLFHFGERFNMPAKTLKKISEILSHENNIIEYIEGNIEVILEDYVISGLEDTESSLYNSIVYDLMMDYSFFGGTVSDIEHVELDTMNSLICSHDYDRDNKIVSFGFESSLSYHANIHEYVGRDVSHSGSVKVAIKHIGEVSFSVNLYEISKPVESSFDYYDFLTYSTSIEEVNTSDYSIDVSFDEDLYRDR